MGLKTKTFLTWPRRPHWQRSTITFLISLCGLLTHQKRVKVHFVFLGFIGRIEDLNFHFSDVAAKGTIACCKIFYS